MATIVKQGPFGIEAFPKSIHDLFDTFLLEPNGKIRESAILPKTDIAETEQNYELQITLPGIPKEDMTIEVSENKLIVKATRNAHQDVSGKKYHKIESGFGTFERSFLLPKNSATDRISASNEHGILTITIPKAEVVNTVQKIEIK